ncbi:MAG: hypothetical protein AAB617_00940 [Patescibacteria group bacterium]
MSFIKENNGSLIVEAIVSISISVVGLLGVLGLLSRSLGLNKDIGHKFIATYLAVEGIEVVKSLIENDFVDGRGWSACCAPGAWEAAYNSTALVSGASPRPLRFDSATGVYNYDGTKPTSAFSRTINITNVSSNEMRVVSNINWTIRGSAQNISLEDHFFNWRVRP